jgi:branched-chain amino acid transport system substrate-binding protein
MVLNFAETQIPVLIDVFKELGIKSVAIIYHDSLHGVEYHDFAVPRMKEAGFEVKMDKQFPMSIKDLSPLLKEAKGLNVDALVGFMYLEEGMLLTRQAMELGINFKAFFLSAVPFTPVYRDTFGAKAVEGVMGGGAWNAKSPGGKTFIELYRKHYNSEVCDYWGPLHYWASLQHFQQAIEEAGTLDQDKIRDLLATRTYDTIIGPFKYDPDRFFRGHVGQIGQWQNGVFEVVDPGKNRTAPPILKPDWPKKK